MEKYGVAKLFLEDNWGDISVNALLSELEKYKGFNFWGPGEPANRKIDWDDLTPLTNYWAEHQQGFILRIEHDSQDLWLQVDKHKLASITFGFSHDYIASNEVEMIDLVMGLVANLPVVYGYVSDRYHIKQRNTFFKNVGSLSLPVTGGTNILESLPGIFWLNIFGAPFVAEFGKDKLNSLDKGKITWIREDALILKAYPHFSEYTSNNSQSIESELEEYLGLDYFFDRSDPKSAKKSPLQVMPN